MIRFACRKGKCRGCRTSLTVPAASTGVVCEPLLRPLHHPLPARKPPRLNQTASNDIVVPKADLARAPPPPSNSELPISASVQSANADGCDDSDGDEMFAIWSFKVIVGIVLLLCAS